MKNGPAAFSAVRRSAATGLAVCRSEIGLTSPVIGVRLGVVGGQRRQVRWWRYRVGQKRCAKRCRADVGGFGVCQRVGAMRSADLGDQFASVGIASQHHDGVGANIRIIAVQHFDDVIDGMAVSSDQFSDAGVTGDDAGSDFGQPLDL